MEIAQWDFSASLGNERLKQLSAPPSFAAIVEEIKTGLEVVCCHLDPCTDMTGFERIIYCIKVQPRLFDLFFNSRTGYRASYYRSPYDGLEANDHLIHSLVRRLLASDQTNATKGTEFIKESLTSPSAKVWLAEAEQGLCPRCDGEWIEPKDDSAEIQNDRWEVGDCSNARRGRKAPFLTNLRIIGAFVNARYDEFVPSRKRRRAEDIHERGWA
jgi:hypothetical protein